MVESFVGKKISTIGIDLENHHLKSYEGYLCLIQITTPDYETFVIDVLALRDHIRNLMGPSIFENPLIQKVFHGCLHSDVAWLQRDFGVALVNVFDT